MSDSDPAKAPVPATYHVDEAGDGVLFGPKGRERLLDPGAPRFFMLGMVRCADDGGVAGVLAGLRAELLAHPLYQSIPSMQRSAWKTARMFHAKDDHPEVRAKVSLIHDVDAPGPKGYGAFLTRKGEPPDPGKIKDR